LRIVPVSLKEANHFVEQYHRHNKRVVAHKFAISLEENGQLIGVGIAGLPVARLLDNGKTLELRRVCVKSGHPNACSKLLARMKQIGQLMGYERIITYTLKKESGSSLKAVNARPVASVKPGKWRRKGRSYAHQAVYDEPKWRWEL
jgi:hypothetical protein